jgi:hypothetical protein
MLPFKAAPVTWLGRTVCGLMVKAAADSDAVQSTKLRNSFGEAMLQLVGCLLNDLLRRAFHHVARILCALCQHIQVSAGKYRIIQIDDWRGNVRCKVNDGWGSVRRAAWLAVCPQLMQAQPGRVTSAPVLQRVDSEQTVPVRVVKFKILMSRKG